MDETEADVEMGRLRGRVESMRYVSMRLLEASKVHSQAMQLLAESYKHQGDALAELLGPTSLND